MDLARIKELAEGTIRRGIEEGVRAQVHVILKEHVFYFDYVADEDSKLVDMGRAIQKIILAGRIAGKFHAAWMISEVWSSSQTQVRPADDPYRRELVFYIAYDENLGKAQRCWEIHRENGKGRLGPERPMGGVKMFLDSAMMPFTPGQITVGERMAAESFLEALKKDETRAR